MNFKKNEYIDLTEELNDALDYKSLLFRQLERCGISFSTPEKIITNTEGTTTIFPPIINSIKWLATILKPYLKTKNREITIDYANENESYWIEKGGELIQVLNDRQMLMKNYLVDIINANHPEVMSFMAKYCLNRMIKENKNCLAFNGGGTGSGKTYAFLSLMEEIYKAQNKKVPLNHIVFRVDQFLNLLNKKNEDGTHYLVAGDVILFDETGVDGNHHNWQSLTNSALNLTAQTFRERNLTVLFTAPVMSYIDSDTRKLFHMGIEMRSILPSKKQTVGKINLISTNSKTGDMYSKYPKIQVDGKKYTIKHIRFNLPSQYIITYYNKTEKEFKRGLTEELEMKIKLQVNSQLQKLKKGNIESMIKEVKKNIDKFTKIYGNKKIINLFKIKNHFKIGRPTANEIKQIIESEMN